MRKAMKTQILKLVACCLLTGSAAVTSCRRGTEEHDEVAAALKAEVLINANLFVGVVTAVESEEYDKVRQIALANLTFFESKARLLVDQGLMSDKEVDEFYQKVSDAIRVADPDGAFLKKRDIERRNGEEDRRIIIPSRGKGDG